MNHFEQEVLGEAFASHLELPCFVTLLVVLLYILKSPVVDTRQHTSTLLVALHLGPNQTFPPAPCLTRAVRFLKLTRKAS